MLVKEQVEFSIKPVNKVDNFYGFSLEDDPMHLMPNGVIFHNSGKHTDLLIFTELYLLRGVI